VRRADAICLPEPPPSHSRLPACVREHRFDSHGMRTMSTAVRAPQRIGLLTATALVVGNMIGSGLFLLPASLAVYGGAALLGWLASAAGALAIAFVFARLSRRWPRSGGPYAYARAAFGDEVGFIVAWSYWVSIWCGNAAIAIGFAGYAGSLLPVLTSTPLHAAMTAVGALWLCTLSNAGGMRAAGALQVLTTVLKLLPLLAIAVCAGSAIEPSAWQPFNRSGTSLWSVLGATSALTLWAFLGIESATVPAADVRDPERNVPRATLIGTLVAIVATIAACMVVVGLLPEPLLAASTAPFADAATRLWGAGAGIAFAAAAAIACFGALNGWVLMQAQVPLAAARDRVFPAWFARLDARGTPLVGLVISSALASVLVFANYHKQLVQLFTFSILLSTAGTLLPYVICTAAELRAQFRQDAARREWLALSITLLALVFSLAALLCTGFEALLWGLALLLGGWPLRAWQRRQAARL
jgi:APA family basic amino acid/polyamine antiporter